MRGLLFGLALLLFLAGCAEGPSQSANVPLEEVPQLVIKVAKDELPGVIFEQAWTTRQGNYEVRGKDSDGKVRDIQVTPSGEVVEID